MKRQETELDELVRNREQGRGGTNERLALGVGTGTGHNT